MIATTAPKNPIAWAPALVMQENTVRLLLEPISRFAIGTEGTVDFYLMPACDAVAYLYFRDNIWNMEFVAPRSSTVERVQEVQPRPFTRETFAEVVNEMKKNAE